MLIVATSAPESRTARQLSMDRFASGVQRQYAGQKSHWEEYLDKGARLPNQG